ncbi:hypothetical protein TB2_029258 [Malus domestica]
MTARSVSPFVIILKLWRVKEKLIDSSFTLQGITVNQRQMNVIYSISGGTPISESSNRAMKNSVCTILDQSRAYRALINVIPSRT